MSSDLVTIKSTRDVCNLRFTLCYRISRLIGGILCLILVLVADGNLDQFINFYQDFNINQNQIVINDIKVIKGDAQCMEGYQIAAYFKYFGNTQCVCQGQVIFDGQCSKLQFQQNCIQQTVAEQQNLNYWMNNDQERIQFCVKRLIGQTNSPDLQGCQSSQKLCGSLGQEFSICVPSLEKCPISNLQVISGSQQNGSESIPFGNQSHIVISRELNLPITEFLISSDCLDSSWYNFYTYQGLFVLCLKIQGTVLLSQWQKLFSTKLNSLYLEQNISIFLEINTRKKILWNQQCQSDPMLQIINFSDQFRQISSYQDSLQVATFITIVVIIFTTFAQIYIFQKFAGIVLQKIDLSLNILTACFSLTCIVIVVLCLCSQYQVLQTSQNILSARCTDQFTQNYIQHSRTRINNYIYSKDISYSVIIFIVFILDIVAFVIQFRNLKKPLKQSQVMSEIPQIQDEVNLPLEKTKPEHTNNTPSKQYEFSQQQIALGPFHLEGSQVDLQNSQLFNSQFVTLSQVSCKQLVPLKNKNNISQTNFLQPSASLREMPRKPFHVRQQFNHTPNSSNQLDDESRISQNYSNNYALQPSVKMRQTLIKQDKTGSTTKNEKRTVSIQEDYK